MMKQRKSAKPTVFHAQNARKVNLFKFFVRPRAYIYFIGAQ